jgi:hypothetical protein
LLKGDVSNTIPGERLQVNHATMPDNGPSLVDCRETFDVNVLEVKLVVSRSKSSILYLVVDTF